MAKLRVNFNKGLRMDLACAKDEVRPIMNCVHFKDGHAYASDGHILVKNFLLECTSIPEEQIEKLDGKNLHRESYKELLKYDVIEISDEGIEATKNGEKSFFYFSNVDGVYPNSEKVLQDALNASPVAMSQVGLNTDYLIKLNKALHGSNVCKYQFKGEGRPIILQGVESASIGIIMPYTFSE